MPLSWLCVVGLWQCASVLAVCGEYVPLVGGWLWLEVVCLCPGCVWWVCGTVHQSWLCVVGEWLWLVVVCLCPGCVVGLCLCAPVLVVCLWWICASVLAVCGGYVGVCGVWLWLEVVCVCPGCVGWVCGCVSQSWLCVVSVCLWGVIGCGCSDCAYVLGAHGWFVGLWLHRVWRRWL